MQIFSIISVLLVCAVVAAIPLEEVEIQENSKRIPETLSGEFAVPLDHFRPQSSASATFTYEYDKDYYEQDGPLFFYLNDFGQYTNTWLSEGLVYDIAHELNGALFTTDLRYFRFNLPTSNVSFENLQFLTLEQAVTDLVQLIHQAKTELNVTPLSKVFLWGSGFGGTLAILARQKFPHLINGVWSSSGIFEPTVFTTENYDLLSSNIFEHGGDACGFRVEAAFEEVERQLVSLNDSVLVNEFRICRPWNISNHMDVGIFSELLINQITEFINQEHAAGMNSFCRAINAIHDDPFRSLARWVRFQFNADFGRCFNCDYKGLQNLLSDEQWHNPGTATGLRQQAFLQCTQLGQLPTTHAEGSFGNRVTEFYRLQFCNEAFGEEYNFERLQTSVNTLRDVHGGRSPGVTHAIFTNGLLDTWYSHGITYYYGPESYVINIPAYGKSADLTSINNRDSNVLYSTKQEITNIFKKWNKDDAEEEVEPNFSAYAVQA